VILLESLEREHVIAAFRAGAKAVFCRDRSATELHKCIDCVAQGRLWIGRVEAEYVLEAIQSAPSCDGMGDIKKLSAREGLVAELAAQGLSNKQIAHRLSLSEHTVKNYIFRIFDKLNVSNRIELSFLMMKRRDDYGELATRILSDANPTNPSVVAAAENGFLAAQFITGMAYVTGQTVEQNDRAAYYWLRRAELNCSQVLQQSRSALNEISARLVPEERQTLEQEIGEGARDNEGLGPKPTMNKAPENDASMTRVAS
jgi:DNA-binding CsgD family transcriptional regulator